MTEPFLNIAALSFRYQHFLSESRQTLDSISLQLHQGDILGLIGCNGAGKTTLVSLIMGLLRPAAGRIEVDNTPVTLGRADIALVPQEYAFYDRLTAQENLQYFAGVCRLDKAEQSSRIEQLLDKCHLQTLAQRRSGYFSSGEKRRLNLAISLLTPVKLLILDEPTANVDPHSRVLILDLIRELNRDGTTVIYTSHLLDEVEHLCNTIALIHEGRLKVAGPTTELVKKYGNANTGDHSIESLFMQLTAGGSTT